jgi:UDP-N-acetylglucosamine 2-epimerase (non-hydrolysing)
MLAAPLCGVSTLTSTRGALALHLAVSRSAAVRLAPVAAALAAGGAEPARVGLDGERAVPDLRLDGTGDVDATTAAVERALERLRPAVAVVAGDGDASVAAALAAARHGVPIARLGAGLRSDDRTVAGEINRIVLDELAELLLVDGEGAAERLRAEGVGEDRIVCVGSTLADTVACRRSRALARAPWERLRVRPGEYVLATLHKPENVGEDDRVARLTEALATLAQRTPLVLCLHPRTRAMMEPMGDLERLRGAGAVVTDALDQLDFLALEARAGAVLTDSAGVQEETTLLGVPCFTLARRSERLLTLTHGTNVLLGDDVEDIAFVRVGAQRDPAQEIPLWDGHAGRRAAAALEERWRSAWAPAA